MHKSSFFFWCFRLLYTLGLVYFNLKMKDEFVEVV